MRPGCGTPAIAPSLATLGVAVAAFVFPSGADGAVACGASVRVEGAPDVSRAIRSLLEEHGIDPSPQGSCPSVEAEVEAKDGKLVVQVSDADGRSSERLVAGIEGAAAVIESWARADMTEALLAFGAEIPPLGAPPANTQANDSIRGPLARALDVSDVNGVSALASRGGRPRRHAVLPREEERESSSPAIARVDLDPTRGSRLSLAAETSVAADGTLWYGAVASGCVSIGPTCSGISARLAAGSLEKVNRDQTETARYGADVLVTIELPLRIGRATLLPGVGLGFGWLRSAYGEEGLPAEARPPEQNSGGPRGDARLTLSLPLSSAFAIDFGLAVGLSPFAHTAPFPSVGDRALEGEPSSFARVRLGAHYGAP